VATKTKAKRKIKQVEGIRTALNGNDSVAEAFRQINPDVVAAYPITPQTELMHKFAGFVSNGEVTTKFVLVESEHSAMSCVIGASAAGCRCATATSANGLALMWEMIYIAASLRLPIVMGVVNRALSGPINIHCDHSDSMGARDSGWIQLFSENCQEAYDNTIQAVRIAENPNVLLPVMVTLDGFILSHTTEVLEILPDEAVKEFVGEYEPDYYLLNPDHPITVGPLDLQDYYFEHKRQQIEAMKAAPTVITDVADQFEQLTGRHYEFIERYRLDDAKVAIVVLGSTAGTAKAVVDMLRDEGKPVGMIKMRVFRPFPVDEIVDALSNLDAVAVFDRSTSFGAMGGPVYLEILAALRGKAVPMINCIYGLGGRDTGPGLMKPVFESLLAGNVEPRVQYVGVRE
jgi:pyruvate ferredoxin oxidoreductase alpha subunit